MGAIRRSGEPLAAVAGEAGRDEASAFGAPLVRPGAGPPLCVAVVVNYDAARVTRACVDSLLASRGANLRVVVVDNASREAERAALREALGAAGIDILWLTENRHFAGGVNAGAARGLDLGAGFLLFLNNDTVLEPDCVRLLVDAAAEHHDAGVVGPALLDLSEPDRALSLGERYAPWSLAVPRTLLRVRRTGDGRPYRVGGIMGSAILVTRECFLRVGPYREDLLVYYEEVDFCLRARRQGFRPLLVPRAVVRHDGMRGFAAGLQPYAARLKARNQIVLVRSHGGALAWLAFAPVYLALLLASSAIYALRGDRAVVAALWRGAVEGVRAALGRRPTAGAV